MPKMDGLALLQQIRASDVLKALPVLMVTAETKKENIIAAAQAGASGYVVKPLLFGELHAVLQKTAAFWLNVNELCPDGSD